MKKFGIFALTILITVTSQVSYGQTLATMTHFTTDTWLQIPDFLKSSYFNSSEIGLGDTWELTAPNVGVPIWPCANPAGKPGKLKEGKCQTVSSSKVYYNTQFYVIQEGFYDNYYWEPAGPSGPFSITGDMAVTWGLVSGQPAGWCLVNDTHTQTGYRIGRYNPANNVCTWNYLSNTYSWSGSYFWERTNGEHFYVLYMD